jgi:hypothetical protein
MKEQKVDVLFCFRANVHGFDSAGAAGAFLAPCAGTVDTAISAISSMSRVSLPCYEGRWVFKSKPYPIPRHLVRLKKENR